MRIKFYKSDVTQIDDYVKLYQRCFLNYPISKNTAYFDWLYNKNPLGKFIGIDAFDYDKGVKIGQVGGVPYEFNFHGEKIKILQAVNVCVDKNYRGNRLFSKMANKFEEYALEENFSMIIAIGNNLATPAWKQSIDMKFLAQLEVVLGYGDLGLSNYKLNSSIFYSIWNKQRINWRRNNPFNKVFIHNKNKIKFSSLSAMSIFKVFSYVDNENYELNYDKKTINLLPNLFIGFTPELNKKNLFFKIPELIKPSPLNFLYKSLDKKNIVLDKKNCLFTYLDFDAY